MNDINEIKTPQDIVEVFNELKKKAEEIGFPIIYGIFEENPIPIELYYHEDYNNILLDKSSIPSRINQFNKDALDKLESHIQSYNKSRNMEDYNITINGKHHKISDCIERKEDNKNITVRDICELSIGFIKNVDITENNDQNQTFANYIIIETLLENKEGKYSSFLNKQVESINVYGYDAEILSFNVKD